MPEAKNKYILIYIALRCKVKVITDHFSSPLIFHQAFPANMHYFLSRIPIGWLIVSNLLSKKICTLKFVYSEKATKFCEISTLLLSTVHTDKCKVEISQNFVAFSEYMNFNSITIVTEIFSFDKLWQKPKR